MGNRIVDNSHEKIINIMNTKLAAVIVIVFRVNLLAYFSEKTRTNYFRKIVKVSDAKPYLL